MSGRVTERGPRRPACTVAFLGGPPSWPLSGRPRLSAPERVHPLPSGRGWGGLPSRLFPEKRRESVCAQNLRGRVFSIPGDRDLGGPGHTASVSRAFRTRTTSLPARPRRLAFPAAEGQLPATPRPRQPWALPPPPSARHSGSPSEGHAERVCRGRGPASAGRCAVSVPILPRQPPLSSASCLSASRSENRAPRFPLWEFGIFAAQNINTFYKCLAGTWGKTRSRGDGGSRNPTQSSWGCKGMSQPAGPGAPHNPGLVRVYFPLCLSSPSA